MAKTVFSYSTVPGKYGQLFDKISSVGVPGRASGAWLASIGFQSSNDRSMLNGLRQTGMVDDEGKPTDIWRQYRAGNRKALANGIRAGYEGLYETYPDAHQRSSAELESFVKAYSDLGSQAVSKAVSSFKALISLADFGEDVGSGNGSIVEAEFRPVELGRPSIALPSGGSDRAQISKRNGNSPSFNIHVHLPSSGDPDLIRSILKEVRGFLDGADNVGVHEA